MKICILSGYYPWGGAGEMAKQYAYGFEKKHEVTFIHCGEKAKEYTDSKHKVIVLELPKRQSPLHAYINFKVLRQLLAVLKGIEPNILHFNNISFRSLSLFSLLFSRRYKTFWTVRDMWPICFWGYSKPYNCIGMKRYCLLCKSMPMVSILNKILKESIYFLSNLEIIVTSIWLRNLLDNSFLSKKRIFHIPNGIDITTFDYIKDAKGRLSFNRDDNLILFAGAMNDDRKGWQELISAFKIVKNEVSNTKLLLVGERPANYDLDNDIIFTGEINRCFMPLYYSASEVFVFPTKAEAFGNVIIEASACQVPVVAFDVGGVRELIDNEKTGFLVKIGDIKALAEKTVLLLKNKELRAKMGLAARKHVIKNFNKEKTIEATERLYSKSLKV